MTLFVYFLWAMLWLIATVVLFGDLWLDLNLPWIPIPGHNRPFATVIAFALLCYNFVRWWTMWARHHAQAKHQEQSRHRPPPPKVVNPAFRFTEEPTDPEQDKGADI